jgi:CBS domain-containing protein
MKVSDVMTRRVHTVPPEASLKDVAAILAEHRISGLPVVDASGELLGVIGKADILVKEGAEVPSGLRRLMHRRQASELETKIEARTAGEAMSAPAITVDPIYTAAEAARIMIEHGINRLPVLEHEKLVGIITRFDLVRAFARSDGEIEREIREETLRGLSWPEALKITVKQGDVLLRGEVDSSFDAEALPAMIRRIPGVVSVDSELACWAPEAQEKQLVSVQL